MMADHEKLYENKSPDCECEKIGAEEGIADKKEAWKKAKSILKTLLFPPTAIILTLLPFSALFLIYMLINGDGGAFSICSYLLAFYVLLTVSLRAPRIIRTVKSLKERNKYVARYLSDAELRVRISLYASLVINVAYSVLQVGLGLRHSSLWYYSLGAYYVILALMRFFLVRFDRSQGNNAEKSKRICLLIGILMLVMTLALSAVIFHMLSLGVIIKHHEITAIAMATYTFCALTLALKEVLSHKERSLVFTVSKSISLTTALVSMITLENTMITSFGEGDAEFLRTMITFTGIAVCTLVVLIALNVIRITNKSLQNKAKNEEKQNQ